jgi:O-antigen/teichoic acid export membrane protein
MVCYTLGGLWLSLYRAPYRCSELEARGSMVVNFWRISDFIITVVVLVLHGRPVFLAECLLAGVLVWTVIGFRDVTRKCSRVRFAFSGVSWKRFREMVVDGLPMLASQAATAFYMQGYPLAVNRALGSSAVVTLTTIRVLCRPSLLAVQTMAWSCSPLLSRSYGAGDWTKYYRLLRIMIATSLWAGTAGLIGLTLVGPWLLNLWTSGKVRSDHLTLFLFALSISLQGVWACVSSTLSSSRRHHEFNYIYGLGTLVALCVVPWLMPLLGFKAVPMVMVAADLCFVIAGLLLSRKKLTNFRFDELTPVLSFSFYKKESSFVWNRFMTGPAARIQEKTVG